MNVFSKEDITSIRKQLFLIARALEKIAENTKIQIQGEPISPKMKCEHCGRTGDDVSDRPDN